MTNANKKNGVIYFYSPPYDYTVDEVAALPEPTSSEVKLWMNNRYQGIKFYQTKHKIEDIKLVAWMFLCLSKIANDAQLKINNPGLT